MHTSKQLRGGLLSLAVAAVLALAAGCGGGGVLIHPGSTLPSVDITGIQQNEQLFNDRRITVNVNGTDSAIATLRVFVDGSQVFSNSYNTFQVAENFTLFGTADQAGSHTVEADATDDGGNAGRVVVNYSVAP